MNNSHITNNSHVATSPLMFYKGQLETVKSEEASCVQHKVKTSHLQLSIRSWNVARNVALA
jgi:hypothetical protein